MKKNLSSFSAGLLTGALLLSIGTTALATSGRVSFNFSNVALHGETKFTAGSTITAPNGQQIPSTILYTDDAGGKTNYLPIRAVSDLLGVEIGYDAVSKTILLGQTSNRHWTRSIKGPQVRYQSRNDTSTAETMTAFRLSTLPEPWKLDRSENGVQWYRNGDAWIMFRAALPGEGDCSKTFDSVKTAQSIQQITVQNHPAEYYGNQVSSLLVWENEDGVLFWLSAGNVSKDELQQIAHCVKPENEEMNVQMNWMPEGYTRMTSYGGGGNYTEIWEKKGQALELICSASPLQLPERQSESVQVCGLPARFWHVDFVEDIASDDRPIHRPVELDDGSTITVTQVHHGSMNNTPVLYWEKNGTYFRLMAPLDQNTMIKIAENIHETQSA